MIKEDYYSKLAIMFIKFIIFCCFLSACNSDKEELLINREQIDLDEDILLTSLIKNTQQTSLPKNIKISEPTSEIEIYNKTQNFYDEYIVHNGEEKILYKINIIHDEQYNYIIKLFDENFTQLQTIELGWCPNGVYFVDVNMDGYDDIVINSGGTTNEIHKLYIWDSISNNFTEVIYEGFDILAWFTVHEGYIENFIRGSTPEDSVKQKLIWNGKKLIKEN